MARQPDEKLNPLGWQEATHFLFNIRGTNGSGKSYALRKLMTGESSVTMEGAYKVTHYSDRNLYVIGSYDNACGGLDTVKKFEETNEMALKYIALGNVAMEGILWSTVFKSSYELDAKLRAMGHLMVWIQMDTPIKTAMDRVMERRALKGNMEPFNPEKVIAKQKSISRTYNRAVDAGVAGFVGDADKIKLFVDGVLARRFKTIAQRKFVDETIKEFEKVDYLEQTPETIANHICYVPASVVEAPVVNSLFDMFGA